MRRSIFHGIKLRSRPNCSAVHVARDERGSVTIVVAFAVVMLVIALGSGVDMWRAWAVKARLQAAVDAAALAIGSTDQTKFTKAQLDDRVQKFFTADYPAISLGTPATPVLSYDPGKFKHHQCDRDRVDPDSIHGDRQRQ